MSDRRWRGSWGDRARRVGEIALDLMERFAIGVMGFAIAASAWHLLAKVAGL